MNKSENQKTIWLYLRVSTQGQELDNNKGQLLNYIDKNDDLKGLPYKWLEEKVSGTVHFEKRELGKIFNLAKKGDVLICFEVSRIGRNYLEIFEFLSRCAKQDIMFVLLQVI